MRAESQGLNLKLKTTFNSITVLWCAILCGLLLFLVSLNESLMSTGCLKSQWSILNKPIPPVIDNGTNQSLFNNNPLIFLYEGGEISIDETFFGKKNNIIFIKDYLKKRYHNRYEKVFLQIEGNVKFGDLSEVLNILLSANVKKVALLGNNYPCVFTEFAHVQKNNKE